MWNLIIIFKNPSKLVGKKIRFVVTRGRGQGRGNRRQVVRRHKLPVIK